MSILDIQYQNQIDGVDYNIYITKNILISHKLCLPDGGSVVYTPCKMNNFIWEKVYISNKYQDMLNNRM